jgi:hypothetical protein
LAAITFPFFSFCIYKSVSDLFPVDLSLSYRWPNDPSLGDRRVPVSHHHHRQTTTNSVRSFVRSFLPSFSFLFICVANRNIRLRLHTFRVLSLSPTNLSLLFSSSSFSRLSFVPRNIFKFFFSESQKPNSISLHFFL